MSEEVTQQERPWTRDVDSVIKEQSGRFTPEELNRLENYRGKIMAVSSDEVYPHSGKPTGDKKMSKPYGEVLGDDLEDYISLTLRLELPKLE